MHRITNVNEDANIGDCTVCGEGVRIKKRYGKSSGTYSCHNKYMETKGDHRGDPANARIKRFNDGTVFQMTDIKKLKESNVSGLCQICKKAPATHIDHCHTKKTLRGLLCNKCNLGLGHFMDDPDVLLSAIEYLRDAG